MKDHRAKAFKSGQLGAQIKSSSVSVYSPSRKCTACHHERRLGVEHRPPPAQADGSKAANPLEAGCPFSRLSADPSRCSGQALRLLRRAIRRPAFGASGANIGSPAALAASADLLSTSQLLLVVSRVATGPKSRTISGIQWQRKSNVASSGPPSLSMTVNRVSGVVGELPSKCKRTGTLLSARHELSLTPGSRKPA